MVNEEYKTKYEEVDIVDYIKVIRKRKWLVLVFFILGIIISLAMPVRYKIQTSLEIGGFIGEERVLEKPAQSRKDYSDHFQCYIGNEGLDR